MSDSYDGVPRKIEWVDDPTSLNSSLKEQLLVMTADRDAWREYASDLGFYRSWADTLAKALNDGEAVKAYELALDYKGTRRTREF
jgi:hypothetical protein